MPSARTRARAAGDLAAVAPIEEQNDLEKPERQLEVLTPKTLGYVLNLGQREVVLERIEGGVRTRSTMFENVTRPIEIPTEFTIGQMLRRDILDDLDAFVQITLTEARRLAPNNDPRMSSYGYIAAALMRSRPRMVLRELVAGLARYTDDAAGSPTVEEIETGMSTADLGAVGMFFLSRVLEQRSEKKAPAGE